MVCGRSSLPPQPRSGTRWGLSLIHISEITKKLKAFEIQDGDQIRVFPIAQGNEDAVYLEGHVIRPGRYSYRPDMRVTDMISSFKDLLPEPATEYAEIIRLNAPDLDVYKRQSLICTLQCLFISQSARILASDRGDS